MKIMSAVMGTACVLAALAIGGGTLYGAGAYNQGALINIAGLVLAFVLMVVGIRLLGNIAK